MSRFFKLVTERIILQDISLIFKRNAGHSKWQNIRHTKGAKDAERANLFTRLSRQMKAAVQEGGSVDPKLNLRLEQIIEQAKRVNMPVATIQSVLKSTQTDKSQCKSHLLDMKGPGNSFILCEVYTASLHQLRQNIATILKKHGAKFTDGTGLHNFQERGVIEVEIGTNCNSEILEKATDDAIEVGAEDVREIEQNIIEFTCEPKTLIQVARSLENLKYNVVNSSVEYIPIKYQTLTGKNYEVFVSLCNKLGNLPDVVRLCDNVDVNSDT